MRNILIAAALLMSDFSPAYAQRPPAIPMPQTPFESNTPTNTPTSSGGQEYKIGQDDLVEIAVFEDPALGVTSRVTASGTISMTLLGTISVAGHTPRDVEKLIEQALKEKYLNDPHVTVFVREYASQPVSVMGAVKRPGIYQLKGQKSLLEMIAMAEGIDSLTAGKTIQILRRDLSDPQRNSATAPERETIAIDTEDLFDNGQTSLNVLIQPGDVINVVRAGSIFVVGEVVHPNEFVLRNGKNITVTQAVALANGTTRDAKKNACVIIRYHRGASINDVSKEEIHVDYGKIISSSANDVTLLPNDILFVPANKVKSGLNRALESTITVAMGRLIYVGF